MTIRPETDELISFLEELRQCDPAFIGRLLSARVPCNDAILHHPTVQAGIAAEYKKAKHMHNRPCGVDAMSDQQGIAGILGVLNGFCGKYDDGPKAGWGPIMAVIEDDGTVSKICRTENKL